MGTLHQTRKGVPAEIKNAKLQNGERVSGYTDRLILMMWKDKKNIFLISTTHDNKMVPSWVRGQGMEKPEVVIDYNSGMGDVDLSDKLSQHKENNENKILPKTPGLILKKKYNFR
jgi:hypothetical protein